MPATAVARRPADIWLRLGAQGGAQALDFAVTSGLRSDRYRLSIDNPATIFAEYEAYKQSYQQTAQQCQEEGLRFAPLIVEAHAGGWNPTFLGVIDGIAKSLAAAQNEHHSLVSLRIAQRISWSLQRENARAGLRRQTDTPIDDGGVAWSYLEDVESWFALCWWF